MDERKNENIANTEPERASESRRDFIMRWAGLIVCTLVLIGCSLLAAEALKRALTVEVHYDELVSVDINELYGTWRYAELAHPYIAISASPELRDEHYSGTVFEITEQRFLATGSVEWHVENPRYVLHALEAPTGSFDDVKAMLGEEVLGYYSILSEGGTVQPYRIYFSRDEYWVTAFSDENEAGVVILQDILRIERAN